MELVGTQEDGVAIGHIRKFSVDPANLVRRHRRVVGVGLAVLITNREDEALVIQPVYPVRSVVWTVVFVGVEVDGRVQSPICRPDSV